MICTQSETNAINRAERAQESRTRQNVRRRLRVPAASQLRERRKQPAVPRDEAVRKFRGAGDERRILVPVRQPGTVPAAGQRAEHRLGAEADRAVRFDQMDGAVEFLAAQFGKPRRQRRVLRRKIIHAVRCRPLPAADPERAEAAIAVINEQRLLRRRSYADR
jgi:hypothetical protein